ncbi:MAG: hypothetical protein D6801_08825 [Alphaproteobacteria bacterium]|nr:MAG: hypothetical protein D6801_08825 [Alphaproteobacteria bacterium]
MAITRREAFTLAGAGLAAAAAGSMATPAAAQSTDGAMTFVQVNMWDRGPDVMAAFDMSNRIMLGTPGAALKDDPGAPMGFDVTQNVIPRGKVKFIATNTSTYLEHEMLVFPISDVTKALPYNTDTERLDEDAAGSLGEIAETAPGETGTLELTLEPGVYMLACNIANHYAMGMWTLIVVI